MAWWEGDSLDRPVVLTPVPRPNRQPFKPAADPGSPAARDLDEEYQLAAHRHRLESLHFAAESAPMAGVGYASVLGLLAVMAGGSVRYAPESWTAWIEKEENLYQRDLPEFSPESPPYAFAVRMIHRYAEVFGLDCILGANPMMDALTTLSLMRGVEELCLDLRENPDTVKRWCRRLTDLYLEIVHGFRAARAEHGRREDMNWTGMWAPGDFDAVHCDFSVMVSPEMFEQFVRPQLERQLEFYDYTVWHLDGADQIKHLEAICSFPEIRGIQWVENEGRRPTERLDLFRRIRRLGKSLIIACPSVEEALELTRQLGKDGLALHIGPWLPGLLRTEREMEDLLRRLRQV
jgi:hypothetical protein